MKVKISIIASALCFSTAIATEASGQNSPLPQPVCMTKLLNDGSLTIIVLADDEAEMALRGFVKEGCAGKDGDLTGYRQKICALSRRSEPGFQVAFERSMGISSNRLCLMADGHVVEK